MPGRIRSISNGAPHPTKYEECAATQALLHASIIMKFHNRCRGVEFDPSVSTDTTALEVFASVFGFVHPASCLKPPDAMQVVQNLHHRELRTVGFEVHIFRICSRGLNYAIHLTSGLGLGVFFSEPCGCTKSLPTS